MDVSSTLCALKLCVLGPKGGCVLEAARGPRCCVVFRKCLEPQILVFEGGRESALHRNPQLLCQLCVHLQVCMQHSKEGLLVSF